MVEIFLYLSYDSWYKEKPDASIKGKIVEKNAAYLEIEDENGYTQILILDKFFAVTYNRREYLY